MGQQGPPGAKKKSIFFKNDPGPHGLSKQVFFMRFDLVMARLGPPEISKCLENGLILGQEMGPKWVKNVFLQK